MANRERELDQMKLVEVKNLKIQDVMLVNNFSKRLTVSDISEDSTFEDHLKIIFTDNTILHLSKNMLVKVI